MATETEIKLKISDVPGLRRALKRIGARPAGRVTSRVHEENVIFDTPQGGLAKHGQLLRIRTETPEATGKSKPRGSKQRAILTFKQPIALASTLPVGAKPDAPPRGSDVHSPSLGPYKVREEIEVEVADAGTMARIFMGLGMSGWFRYEKYRTTFRLPDSKAWAKGLLIELDETPIGTFVELEGPAAAIDRSAAELGFTKRDYVLENYLRLYVEHCRKKGEEPRHMLFSNHKTASK